MDEERRGLSSPVPRRPMSALTALLGILVAVSMSPGVAARKDPLAFQKLPSRGHSTWGLRMRLLPACLIRLRVARS